MGATTGSGGFFENSMRVWSVPDAERRLQELYGDLQLTGIGGYAEQVLGDDRFSIARLSYRGDLEIHADPESAVISFSTPGHFWKIGDLSGDLSKGPVVFQPGQAMASRTSGNTTVTAVSFRGEALASIARAIYGGEVRLNFDHPRAIDTQHGADWTRLVKSTWSGAAVRNELTRTLVYRELARTVLESFALPGDRRERALSAAGRFEAYIRARHFIDAHLSLPINTADIAQAANVSEQQLHAIFEGHASEAASPGQYLRAGRLDAVRREVMNLGLDRTMAVSQVARRWGYPVWSTFVVDYRTAFGVHPASDGDGYL